jgi:hypothetical protein
MEWWWYPLCNRLTRLVAHYPESDATSLCSYNLILIREATLMPDLGQAHKCGRVKLINGIQPSPFLNSWISPQQYVCIYNDANFSFKLQWLHIHLIKMHFCNRLYLLTEKEEKIYTHKWARLLVDNKPCLFCLIVKYIFSE